MIVTQTSFAMNIVFAQENQQAEIMFVRTIISAYQTTVLSITLTTDMEILIIAQIDYLIQ